MRIKLAILMIGLFVVFAGLTNWFIIGNLEKDAKSKLEQGLTHTFQVYRRAQRANTEERLDLVRSFAKEQEIIDAMMLPAETDEEAEERHFKLFEKLEVLSRLRYKADFILILDQEGNELARTKVASWKKNNFGEKPIIKEALKGTAGENIWTFEKRIAIVDAAPIMNQGEVIGTMAIGNVIGEALVKQERDMTIGDFAYFSRNRVLVSTLNSNHQAALNEFVSNNSSKIAKVLLSKGDYFQERIKLGMEDYLVILSPISSISNHGIAGVMILKSETKWLSKFGTSRQFLALISFLFIIIGSSIAILILQKAYAIIDFFLEGAHQITIGNKDYEFRSEDPTLNAMGQTMNLMIAILLGKYIPEDDDEEISRISFNSPRGAAKPAPERLLIETMDEKESTPATADSAPAPAPVADRDAYFENLYNEFIAAKKQAGDDITQITKDRMIAKLKRTEEKLIEKHNCKGVVFTVKQEKGKVTLKPSPIWE